MNGQGRVFAVISIGGVIGSLARYALGQVFPTPNGFPWTTFAINVFGCLLIGALMAYVTERWSDRPLVRPFLGVGVLGGFTTFSTYEVDALRLINAHDAGTALAYLAGTFIAAIIAVYIGDAIGDRLAR
jgi:CrcB protein